MTTAERIIKKAGDDAEAYARRVGLTDPALKSAYRVGLLNREIVVLCEELHWAKRELRMARALVAADDAPPDASDFESMCRATALAAGAPA